MSTTKGSLGSRYRSLGDLVADELRDRIISGELAAETRLVERDLAHEMEVSRVVVREAMQQLSAEGLVTIQARRGAQVAPLDLAAAEHLFEVRLGLETFAAELAAGRRTEADLERLASLMAQADAATAAGDHRTAVRVNHEFHEAIVDIAANPLLASIMRSLSGQVQRLFWIGQSLRADGFHAEHQGILDAIRGGAADEARRRMGEHIRSTREGTLERLRVVVS